MPAVIETAIRFRSELARQESSATNDLITSYQRIVNRLEDKITVLMSRIELAHEQGNLTPELVRKQAVWSSLLNQIEDEIKRYGGFVDTQNQLSANKAIDLAGKHSGLLTRTHFENNPALLQAFNATWDRLPNESVETLLGFLQNDSELSRRLRTSLGSSAAQNFQNKLLEGIALGYNPKKINQLINQTLAEPLTWSLNSVRTTTQYAYRESTRANYINNSEIVGGWKWYAALDGRVCLSCVSKHGQLFTNEQRLNDHHQGRCTQIPIIKDSAKFGLSEPEIELGEAWFNNLPKGQQLERMGIERHKAYQQGKFKFDDLSETYQNDVFGEMLKERSLKSLLSLKTTPKISVPKSQPILGEIFKIDSSVKQLEKGINQALKAIEKVHTLPKDSPKILIVKEPVEKLGLQGSFVLNSDRSPKEITLSLKGFNPKTTLLHEIGHYIDFGLISITGDSSVESYDIFANWRKAIESSASYKKLIDIKNNLDKYTFEYSPGLYTKADKKYTEYLLSYSELWARSYAQYVVDKNKFTDFDQYNPQYPMQWDKQDFKAIERAFDELFEKLKWK